MKKIFFIISTIPLLASAEFKVIKVYRNKTKAVITYDRSNPLEIKDMVTVRSSTGKNCDATVIDVKNGKALLSIGNCDFIITVGDVAFFKDSSQEESWHGQREITNQDESSPKAIDQNSRGKQARYKQGSSRDNRRLYFEFLALLTVEGSSDYKAFGEDFDVDVKDKSSGSLDLYFSGFLTERKYVGISLLAGFENIKKTATIIGSDIDDTDSKVQTERIYSAAGVEVAPAILDDFPVRPYLDYAVGNVDSELFIDGYSHGETKIKNKVFSYGLRYDLDKRGENSYFMARISQIKRNSDDGAKEEEKSMDLIVTIESSENSYFQAGYSFELKGDKDRAYSFAYKYKNFLGQISSSVEGLPESRYEPDEISSFGIGLGVIFDFKL